MFLTDGYSAELLKNLSALVESKRVPHSMIIDGGSVQKREELALNFAGMVLCASEDLKPCGECASCKKVVANSHPDIKIVEAEDKKKTISVDVIRAMREDVYILPNESEKKIYIIKNAETMQPYAQNALLKILEEPPQYAVFILLCEYHKILLPTVLSRCVVFNIGATKTQELTEKKEKQAQELTQSIALAVANKNEYDLLMITSAFEKNAELLQASLTMLELIFRDALILCCGGKELISHSEESARILITSLDKMQLLSLIDAVKDISEQVKQYANNNLTITRLCSTLIKATQVL